MTTATGISALTEIEYRAWWLEQELGDRGSISRAVLAEELAGIRNAVERERGAQAGVSASLATTGDQLDHVLAELRARSLPEPSRRDHLRILPRPGKEDESDG